MLLTLVVLVVLYTVSLWIGVLHSYTHLHVLLLAVQYIFILPAILAYLRADKDKSAEEQSTFPTLCSIALLFALVTFPLSWLSTRGLLNPDESGYSFGARIFLSGHLKARPLVGATPNVRNTPGELFFANHVLQPDGWFPKFPPGWPALLTSAYAIDAPWVVTPILGILSLLIVATIGRQLFSPATGILAAWFAILSSFYLVNSIGLMSHALCGLLSAFACFCLLRGLETGRLGYFWGMFASLGYALQVRPYTAFVLAVVMTVAALWGMRANRAPCVRIFATGCLIGAIAVSTVLSYNRVYTGRWLVSPYALAAGETAPPELSFRPSRILRGIAEYGHQTFEESLIGVFPFTYLLAGYALFMERERRREVWILAAIYLSLLVAYLAHPQGSGIQVPRCPVGLRTALTWTLAEYDPKVHSAILMTEPTLSKEDGSCHPEWLPQNARMIVSDLVFIQILSRHSIQLLLGLR